MRHPAPLLVTAGEPAGVGPDILLAAWQNRQRQKIPSFLVHTDPRHLEERAAALGINASVSLWDETTLSDAVEAFDESIPVLPLKTRFKANPGTPNCADASGITGSIRNCVDLLRSGLGGAVVTLPINKSSLYDAGFRYPGHTEFLGALAEDWPQAEQPVRPVMMLAGPELRAVPVTIHIPLHAVPAALNKEDIVATARILHRDLQSRFGIVQPRIAVSGLNPHAGEDGALGDEDAAVIAPAVERLQAQGIACRGPLPADTMFHDEARKTYDAALCMYHDQALIPAKALAFHETVNVTLGLPFIRTSPDHGTAFDIAGTGKANPASFIAALRMAQEMSEKETS